MNYFIGESFLHFTLQLQKNNSWGKNIKGNSGKKKGSNPYIHSQLCIQQEVALDLYSRFRPFIVFLRVLILESQNNFYRLIYIVEWKYLNNNNKKKHI